MKYLFAVALSLLSFSVCAQTGTAAVSQLEWVQSLAREPVPPATVGVPLAANEIKQNTIYYSVDADIPLVTGFVGKPLPASVSSVDVVGGISKVVSIALAPRVNPYTIRFGVTTTDVFGLESKPVIKAVSMQVKPGSAPAAVQSFNVQFTCSNGNCTATPVP